jgi:hypothetical protein
MTTSTTARRVTAASCLVLTSALSVVSAILQPDFAQQGSERLEAIAAAGGSATISAVTFVLAQLPFIGAVLGIAYLLSNRAPKLAAIGAALGIVGAFGHSVFGGTALMMVTMAGESDAAPYGGLIDDFESSPFMVFAALGLLGTVLGLLLLAAGLWRADAAPRWVPVAIVAFIVVEFVGTSITAWASSVSSLLYLASFTALAVTVMRSPDDTGHARPSQRRSPSSPERIIQA